MIASLVVTGLVLGIRQSGGLQGLQLAAYDRLMQLHPAAAPDPRLLIVEITERDIQNQGTWPLKDGIYAQALSQLLKHQPRAIGLDIYRDLPMEPGREAFINQLKSSDRTFVITKHGSDTEVGIPPPAEIADSNQIGFNDVVVDPGGVIRRNLLYQGDQYYQSFSLLLALRYLRDLGITDQPSSTNPEHLQIGKAVFKPLEPNSGNYINSDVGGYQILLNYRAAQDSFATVTLTQLLRGEVAPDLIKDRIVLIGTTSETGKDFFYTPYSSGLRDRQRIPGVFIHAHMVSQILDAALGKRPLFWDWPEPMEMLWIGVWSVIGGVLAWRIRNSVLLALGSGGAMVLLLGTCTLLFWNQGWVPLVAPLLTFLGTGGAVITYTAQQAQQQQKMVMRLLGQNTSPEVAETLWQRRDDLLEGGKLPGQMLTATVLFTDLQGFSTIAEQLSPNILLDWLNEYLDEMTQAVQAHHGVINKFMGDGIMAVFGVPIARENEAAIAQDAKNAVACALEMGERLARLNTHWHQQKLPDMKIRAGVFTGSVIAGSVGSKIRLEYGVLGDGVNTASRLESLEKQRQPTACRVLIAEETLQYVQDSYDVEDWGSFILKGKVEPVDVYRIKGPVAGSADSKTLSSPSRHPL